MAVVNVAITNTFDEWRTRTNQIAVQSNSFEAYIVDLYGRSNNSPSYAYANSVGVQANAFASISIASNNTTVGNSANAYARGIGNTTNSYIISIISGANTAVGTGANSYAATVVGGFANTNAANATYLTVGTVPVARLSGSYTSITGVGTITTGVWNGTDIAVTDGGTGASDAATARTNLGLGTMSTQGSGAVTITGGSISGITDLAVTDGGTGASDAATARTNLGLGTMSTQGSGAVTITGGSISGLSSLATTGGTISTMAYQGSGAVNITGGSISGLSSLAVSGAITATGDVTAFSSDARLKGDIQTITDALSKVKLITGVTYIHNDIAKSFGYTDESRFAGVLAQEVEAVLPEVVVPAPFDVAGDGTSKSGENYKTVKYEKIVPLLIEAIKELTAKVEMLESRVNE
jgi:hypothetical protein